MRTVVLTLFLAVSPAALSSPAQTAACTAAPTKPTGSITASGCVAHGVEAKCLILRDAKSGKTYSLFFAGLAPAAGTAITFSGEPFKGVSACMQANAVTVKTCTIVQMSCPAPPSAAH